MTEFLQILDQAPLVDAGVVRTILTLLGLVVLAGVAYRLIGRWSRWYALRLEAREFDGHASESGVIRMRRHDTRARVLAAASRAIVVVVLGVIAMHLLMPDRASALLGTALLAALVGFTLQPLIRDAVAGSIMMAERWFHVGDSVYVEPHGIAGVVEHFNLRSTELRTLAGERVIVHNSTIFSVSVARRGMRTMGLEIIVRDRERGEQIIEQVNRMLPHGHSQVVLPLRLTDSEELGELGSTKLWRLVAKASVANQREWLLTDFAVKLCQEVDDTLWPDQHVIMHGPLVYNSDSIADARLRQSVLS